MAKKANPWVVGAIGVGVSLAGFFVYRALTAPPKSAAPTTDAAKLKPVNFAVACENAAKLVAIQSPDKASYDYWANLCHQGGGNTTPWPS